MNGKNLKAISQTDWNRIKGMTDDEVDLSDSPALDEHFFANARLRLPKNDSQRQVLLGVDAEVLEWFEDQGPNFQFRMSDALKEYADAHR